MKAIGSMTKQTAKGFTSTRTGLNTWETGRMINNTVRVRNPGLMERNTLGNTTKEKSTEKALSISLMEAGTKGASIIMILKEEECIFGLMRESMKAAG